MNVNRFILNITSEQPEELVRFYRDVVGLAPLPEVGEGGFDAAGTGFIIDGHSEVHGPAQEPQRMLINFFVDDAAAETSRLKSAGVRFIREGWREEWGGVISTFLDPDGNYCQLIEFQPPAA